MYYLAQRKLGLSPDGWDDLAWHHQQMFLEGFEAEGLLEGGAAASVSGAPAEDNFDSLDHLMAGAKTRRAGRERDGQG